MMSNKFYNFNILFLLLVLIIACSHNNNNEFIKNKNSYKINYNNYFEPKNENKNIKISFDTFVTSFDPYSPDSDMASFLTKAVYSTLFTIDPSTGHIEKNLIEEYSINDNGLFYFMKLKDGIRFHDGSKLTSYDVIASINLLKTVLKNSKIYNIFFSNNKELTILPISELSFSIEIDSPNAMIIKGLTSYPVLKKEYAQEIENSFLLNIDSQKLINIEHAIGTGAFYLSKIDMENSLIVLNKNKDYFKKEKSLPYTDKISITINSKKKGDIIVLKDKSKKKELNGYKLIDTGENGEAIVLCFSNNGITENKNFRKFICETVPLYYLNKNKLAKKIDLSFSQNNMAHFGKNNINILIYKEEKKLLKLALLIKSMYSDKKIEATIINVNYTTFLESIKKKEGFDFALFYYKISPYNLSFLNLATDDFSLFDVKNQLSLLENIKYTETYYKQIELIKALQNNLMDDYQYLLLDKKRDYYLVSNKIRNFKVNSTVEEGINLNTIEHIFKEK